VATDNVPAAGGKGKKAKAKATKKPKEQTSKGKKTKGTGAVATTVTTTTPPQQLTSSLPSLATSTPVPTQAPGEQEDDDDDEFARMCELALLADDGATGQAGEGCNDDDDDDFARICESVWDSIPTEEEAVIANADVANEVQQYQHDEGDGREDDCLYSGELVIEDPSRPAQEVQVPVEGNEQGEAQQVTTKPVDYESEESEEEGGDLPPLHRPFYRFF